MPNHPSLRKVTKVVCWIYLISLVLFVSYAVIMLDQVSLDNILIRIIALLGLISAYVFILDAMLLAVIGTIDLWNKPRSKFTITITIINYFAVVIVLLFFVYSLSLISKPFDPSMLNVN